MYKLFLLILILFFFINKYVFLSIDTYISPGKTIKKIISYFIIILGVIIYPFIYKNHYDDILYLFSLNGIYFLNIIYDIYVCYVVWLFLSIIQNYFYRKNKAGIISLFFIIILVIISIIAGINIGITIRHILL